MTDTTADAVAGLDLPPVFGNWEELYRTRKRTAKQALQQIKRGNRVFIGSGCAEPQHLAQALEELVPTMVDLEILHILSVGKTRFTEPGLADKCRLKSFFVAAASREAIAEGRADYTPINLVDIPELFRSGAMPIDVALIQVSPPDRHGFCSLGIAVDIIQAAAQNAQHVIAQVNPRMPLTLGNTFIHVRDIHAFVEHEEELLEVGQPLLNDIALDIGRHVAKLIDDGSTVRAGVGSISTAVLYALEDKKDLGVHADMLTDAYLHLVKKGAITNRRKTVHPGKIITSFCLGSRELYDFVQNNPMVELHPIDYTNNYIVISENDRMVSINSGLEVDLSGQVCSDSLGYEIYSGVGGAIDFLRGARHSKGGKAIVVLPSTTMDGKKSRIVPHLTEGAGVVTTRGGVQYVVTEFGIAQLYGKSIRERALALIGIAHPDFREELMNNARRVRLLDKTPLSVMAAKAVYPAEWEIFQIFEAGTRVFFRPAKPTDERSLKEFFYSLPREEAYIRFLSDMKVFPHYHLSNMINIDYNRSMTILGLAGGMDSDRVIAIGRYVSDPQSHMAEIDFSVHPDFGRKGVASFLIHRIAQIARTKGISTLVAYISAGNERVLGVFQKLGYMVESSFNNQMYEIRLYIDKPAEACLTD